MTEELLEWLWITAAVEFTGQYIPPAAAPETPAATAREFLLAELEAGRIRYRHGKPIYRGWAFPLSYFWARLGELVAHEIAPNNAVIRKGPALVRAELVLELPSLFKPDNEPKETEETERYVADPQGSMTVVELPLVQLHRDDILRRMQACGHLPLQHKLPLSSLPAVKWDPLTDWSADAVSRELDIQGPAITKIVEALPTLSNLRAGRYHGKTVIELLEQVSANMLAKALNEPGWEDSIGRLKNAWKNYNGVSRRSS
jgi:hypothetical protein